MKTTTEVADLARALGDPTRIRTLQALEGRELCLCQVVDLFRLAPSTQEGEPDVRADRGGPLGSGPGAARGRLSGPAG